MRAGAVRVVGDDDVSGLQALGPYSSIVLRTESVIVPVKSTMLLLMAGVA